MSLNSTARLSWLWTLCYHIILYILLYLLSLLQCFIQSVACAVAYHGHSRMELYWVEQCTPKFMFRLSSYLKTGSVKLEQDHVRWKRVLNLVTMSWWKGCVHKDKEEENLVVGTVGTELKEECQGLPAVSGRGKPGDTWPFDFLFLFLLSYIFFPLPLPF